MWSSGLDFEAGRGEAADDQVRPVLDLLELALDKGARPAWSAAAKLAMDRLSGDQMPNRIVMRAVPGAAQRAHGPSAGPPITTESAFDANLMRSKVKVLHGA